MLDIIIVNYNSTDYLLKCLESIYSCLQNIPSRVFVQDNHSEDDADRIKDKYSQVILTKNSHNTGFSKAVNRALMEGDSPYIGLLNPDSYVLGNFFQPIIKYMDNNPEVGIIGPQILDHDGSVQGSARTFPTPLTGLFGRSSLLTRFFPNNPFTRENILTTQSDGKTPMEVDWVSGACMVVRRKAVDDIGLMDERFFLYWEDADWCKRMWENGWKVVYFPQGSVIHYVGGSSTQAFLRSSFEFHTSSYKLFEKHNKTSFWFVKPLAITGISLRLCLVMISNGIILWHQRHPLVESHKKESIALEKDRKIKILRIIARLNIGGPAIHVHLLTEGLDKKKFELILAVGKLSPQEGDMSYLFDAADNKPIIIPELQREISLRMDLKALQRIFSKLIQEKPDIVHTHTAKAGTSARLAVLMYNLIYGKKVRIVHTFHGYVFEGYFSKAKSLLFVWIERLLARFTDVIIALSGIQKKELVEKFRIAPTDKIKTVQLGFDLRPFLGSEALKGQFRRSLGISNDTLLIGIVGRLVPIKNHFMFFNAAQFFLEHNPDANIKFIVIGDGELRDGLEGYSTKLGLDDHVVFCGWMRNVPMVYADLDILALTSSNEGTPVSIIESMASSVPVIATDAGGVIDLLGPSDGLHKSDGFEVCERGILCRKNDAQGFTKGLKYLIDGNIQEKQKRLMRARSFAIERFSEKRLLNDIESLYIELMANRT
ncbi:MAG TPA: glycosyltransferase [Desulfatiglandales bacterium]|nr:glycosyltransferase [Desulfatiglandales bacterium]